MKISIGRVAALAACAFSLALGSLMTAGPASATSVTGNAVQPLASAHNCKVAGQSGSTQGVFCADIVDEGGGVFLVKTEAYCQNASTGNTMQCADINYGYEGASANDGGAFHVVSQTHFCGHSAGACPSGRLAESFGASVGSCDEVWTVVLSGARIQLPGSDVIVTLTSNFASAHASVC